MRGSAGFGGTAEDVTVGVKATAGAVCVCMKNTRTRTRATETTGTGAQAHGETPIHARKARWGARVVFYDF